jgi:hypothetical protein
MRRTTLTLALLTCLGVPMAARAQEEGPGIADPEAEADVLEERLRTLQRGTRELNADVGNSYRRLAAISMSIFEGVDGARVTITQENDVGPFYRLVSATYAIDGSAVFHRRDESGALGAEDEIEIHDGSLSPGEHTLSVVLRYRGDGGEIVRYLEGYRFVVRSSRTFLVPPGRHTRLRLRTFTRGPDVPYERRLGVEHEREVGDLR